MYPMTRAIVAALKTDAIEKIYKRGTEQQHQFMNTHYSRLHVSFLVSSFFSGKNQVPRIYAFILTSIKQIKLQH